MRANSEARDELEADESRLIRVREDEREVDADTRGASARGDGGSEDRGEANGDVLGEGGNDDNGEESGV